jgi:hypothetical protein
MVGSADGLNPLIWAVLTVTGSNKFCLPPRDEKLDTLFSTVVVPDGTL